jgi:hypothetical protein
MASANAGSAWRCLHIMIGRATGPPTPSAGRPGHSPPGHPPAIVCFANAEQGKGVVGSASWLSGDRSGRLLRWELGRSEGNEGGGWEEKVFGSVVLEEEPLIQSGL